VVNRCPLSIENASQSPLALICIFVQLGNANKAGYYTSGCLVHIPTMGFLTMKMVIAQETWALRGVFRIARGARTHADVVTVTLDDNGVLGQGECVPYARYSETSQSVSDQLESVREQVETGISIEEAQDVLPPGAARNALDCALWDLLAKKTGKPVWQLAGLEAPQPVLTAFTISLDAPDAMAAAAIAAKGRPLLKVKIGGAGDIDRVRAVAKARPDARLIVDANEGLSEQSLPDLLAEARNLNIDVIEQPFAATKDSRLGQVAAPIAICADESFHTSADIEHLLQNYDAVNIKLDKTGGFTEGLKAVRDARAAGLRVMVGCMVGTSLVTAPAVLLAQLADWTDLDGPLLLDQDRRPGLRYDGSILYPPESALWG
jgi:L-Ala-D/L-Glu epimerase